MHQRERAVATVLFLLFWVAPTRADSLAEIREGGSLRWGGDISGGGPYVYQGPDGQLMGFEYELMDYV
jgi:polar amino acid transport system substrate-binding protein